MNYTSLQHHINMKTQTGGKSKRPIYETMGKCCGCLSFFIILKFLVPLKQPSSRPSTKDLHLFLVFHVKMMIQSQLQTSAR